MDNYEDVYEEIFEEWEEEQHFRYYCGKPESEEEPLEESEDSWLESAYESRTETDFDF